MIEIIIISLRISFDEIQTVQCEIATINRFSKFRCNSVSLLFQQGRSQKIFGGVGISGNWVYIDFGVFYAFYAFTTETDSLGGGVEPGNPTQRTPTCLNFQFGSIKLRISGQVVSILTYM